MPEYPFGTLGKEVRRDIADNYDCKIIITSHNSKPGLGKTTLAVLMARAWQEGWTAEENAFMNAYRFHNRYQNADPGTVLLFDEVENEADNRRSNAAKNVELSQMLATDRYRNLVSIFTLPTVSMLDNRIMELSDYWINVMTRGKAHPHKIYVNDYNGNVSRKWIGQEEIGGTGEVITWNDVPDDDPDKEYLDQLKRKHNHLEEEYVPRTEVDEIIEKKEESAKKELRDKAMREVYHETELSQNDLASLEFVDLNQSTVQRIVSE